MDKKNQSKAHNDRPGGKAIAGKLSNRRRQHNRRVKKAHGMLQRRTNRSKWGHSVPQPGPTTEYTFGSRTRTMGGKVLIP